MCNLNFKISNFEEEKEQNSFIKEENISYSVVKFEMVTMKLIGNFIFCDDKSSVSIIDCKNMHKLESVSLTSQENYIYSVYNHHLSDTVFLAFDNKQI
jgi:hypothetical protein